MRKVRILLFSLSFIVFFSGCDDLGQETFEGSLSVGDEGPAGGIVIFVDTNSQYDFDYLEAAPVDLGSDRDEFAWGDNVEVPGTNESIGEGASNTEKIISIMDEEWRFSVPYAAKAATNFNYGGFNDWFLPSKDELNLIHENRESFSGLRPNQYYYSSTEAGSSNRAWAQMINDDTGRQADSSSSGKLTQFSVRVIRSFMERDI